MKILIISANTLPAAPSGPAYVAGAALSAGHTVEIFTNGGISLEITPIRFCPWLTYATAFTDHAGGHVIAIRR